MKFLKYGGIGLGIQIFLLMLLGIINQFLHLSDEVEVVFLLGIYYPFIMFVTKSGNFKGESAMIEAPIIGIVLGMFFYSTIIGLAIWLFSNKKI